MFKRLFLALGLVVGAVVLLRTLRALACGSFLGGILLLPLLLVPAVVLFALGVAGAVLCFALAVPLLILATPLLLVRKLVA